MCVLTCWYIFVTNATTVHMKGDASFAEHRAFLMRTTAENVLYKKKMYVKYLLTIMVVMVLLHYNQVLIWLHLSIPFFDAYREMAVRRLSI